MDFSELGLNPQLLKALSEKGYTEPTPIQAATIPTILEQKDIMAGAQTGTGKTAAFALPVLQQLSCLPVNAEKMATESADADINVNRSTVSDHPVRALVLTPTRELAQQVYRSFVHYGKYSLLRSALVYGGASVNTQIKELGEGVDILVATPGRLLDLISRGAVNLSQIEHLVFDEADRMLDMGFIIEIKRILKSVPSERQTLLFSATFDQQVFDLSKTLLRSPVLIEVDARNTAAIQVEQIVYAVDADRKRELVSHMIGARNWHQVLIFTRTKQGADNLASEMCKDGLKTQSIHGDKSQGARERALEDFRQGHIRALVATDVAARGLDIDQLKYVINYELPFNAEDYIHRIGRTGRAGGSGLAVSLLSADENYLLEEVEAILDTSLPQQWLPGYEPDFTKEVKPSRKNSRAAQKQRARDRALGKKPAKRKR
ncbi:DEAD/DEAH box helicase [Motiliproteus sp. MSK22-1]|uniref:DEAD/DEAH box helicase n=1 Tax=Motiliproteus sp. MSK22-1 TaxID=1897630 RepID=UPI0009787A68|nr:DEAD/DEAH box helicase [Motiliproteus sp. MSK22-1]OMH36149.1 DEAD/DEAH box helicase [Motiliproteus sp. MSK22-1]